MHKFILTLTLCSLSFSALAQSRNEKILETIKDLGEKILSAKELAPKNHDEAFALRNSIDHPIESKNKSLGYCRTGVWPLAKRVELEIPFRINRKNSCKKSIPKMVEKGSEVMRDIYAPIFGRAILLGKITQELYKSQRENLMNNCPALFLSLNRLNIVTTREQSVTNPLDTSKSVKTLEAIQVLSSMDISKMPKDYELQRQYLEVYKSHLNAVDFYAQNFRYDKYFKFLDETVGIVNNALRSGCLR